MHDEFAIGGLDFHASDNPSLERAEKINRVLLRPIDPAAEKEVIHRRFARDHQGAKTIVKAERKEEFVLVLTKHFFDWAALEPEVEV
jgi:hypothetical protein